MAKDNNWGYRPIQGELQKLEIIYQGIDNKVPEQIDLGTKRIDLVFKGERAQTVAVRCKQFLGGLLKSCYRKAA